MKKIPSQRFLPQLALKLAAKPSEMVELFGVSRNYLHKLSNGQRPMTGRVLEKAAAFVEKDRGYKAVMPSASPVNRQRQTHSSPTVAARKVAVLNKKINDVQSALNRLKQTEDALVYVSYLSNQFESKSVEHDWCKLHVRRLKHRLPKDPDLQRTEWEAKLAGLLGERRYWEKKGV
jgi:hypothetical protein